MDNKYLFFHDLILHKMGGQNKQNRFFVSSRWIDLSWFCTKRRVCCACIELQQGMIMIGGKARFFFDIIHLFFSTIIVLILPTFATTTTSSRDIILNNLIASWLPHLFQLANQ